jgi:hypothetical protein
MEVTMHGVGMYNTDWNTLGEGLFDSGQIHNMILNGSSLYFVGHFRWDEKRDVLLSNIARYDLNTQQWNPVGGGKINYNIFFILYFSKFSIDF